MGSELDPAAVGGEGSPGDFLRRFIELFREKGWLNEPLRIRHRAGSYRVCCSETQFVAQRINENGAAAWGFPCWVVCLVTGERMAEEAEWGAFASAEPTVRDWLACFAEGDFEIL